MTKKVSLVVGDFLIYFLSVYLMILLRYGYSHSHQLLVEHYRLFLLFYPVWFFLFYVLGLYEVRVIRAHLSLVAHGIRALLIGTLLMALIFYITPGIGLTPKTNLLLFVLIFGAIFYLWRILIVSYFDRLLLSKERIAILYRNKKEEVLARELANEVGPGYEVMAILPFTRTAISALVDEVGHGQLSTIALHSNGLDDTRLSPLLFRFIPLVRFKSLSILCEQHLLKIPLGLLTYSWFFRSLREDEKKLHEFSKRLLDVTVSSLALVVMVIAFPFIYLAIQLEDAGPVFYRQKRVGRFGREFEVIKFRSMKVDSEGGKAQWAQKNDDRTTKIGRILRKTSLDELPQCLNILSGVMSAVGPRPERPEFTKLLDKEIPFYEMRHLVKPGLTGWAQINYPYGASVEDARRKLEYDLYYVKHRSLILDIKTILKTFGLYLKNERAKLAR